MRGFHRAGQKPRYFGVKVPCPIPSPLGLQRRVRKMLSLRVGPGKKDLPPSESMNLTAAQCGWREVARSGHQSHSHNSWPLAFIEYFLWLDCSLPASLPLAHLIRFPIIISLILQIRQLRHRDSPVQDHISRKKRSRNSTGMPPHQHLLWGCCRERAILTSPPCWLGFWDPLRIPGKHVF